MYRTPKEHFMSKQELTRAVISEEDINESTLPLIEDVLEKRLDKVVTILDCKKNNSTGVYNEILSMVEKALINIAMRRSNNIQTAAADFLGINRNTLHNKIKKMKG